MNHCSSNDAAARCSPHVAIRHSRGPWKRLLRVPNQIWVIEPAFVSVEVPIFGVLESLRVAVEKTDIGSMVVKIGMHVVLLRDPGQLAVIK